MSRRKGGITGGWRRQKGLVVGASGTCSAGEDCERQIAITWEGATQRQRSGQRSSQTVVPCSNAPGPEVMKMNEHRELGRSGEDCAQLETRGLQRAGHQPPSSSWCLSEDDVYPGLIFFSGLKKKSASCVFLVFLVFFIISLFLKG